MSATIGGVEGFGGVNQAKLVLAQLFGTAVTSVSGLHLVDRFLPPCGVDYGELRWFRLSCLFCMAATFGLHEA